MLHRVVPLVLVLGLVPGLGGCVSNQLFNPEPAQYLQTLRAPEDAPVGLDLAIIEFDEFGMLWEPAQLEDAIALIARRSAASERGIVLVTYTHGWQNNADPEQVDGDLVQFRDRLELIADQMGSGRSNSPDHLVGVYLGWRGASNRVPGLTSLTFWARKDAAERVASFQMREVLFGLTAEVKRRPESKVFLGGHSMGGMILARTLAPTLATLLLASGPDGVLVPADLIMLHNPALDGLAVYQMVEYLKRTGARAELRSMDGTSRAAEGPVMVSITSDADWVTRLAYPAGQMLDHLTMSFRDDLGEGVPSQGRMANRAHGHLDFLVSHRATLVDGEVVIEPVEGAYNDTPFWIVRVSREICGDHSDIYNPRYGSLLEQLVQLNRVYEVGVQTWVTQSTPSMPVELAPGGAVGK